MPCMFNWESLKRTIREMPAKFHIKHDSYKEKEKKTSSIISQVLGRPKCKQVQRGVNKSMDVKSEKAVVFSGPLRFMC